MTNISSNEAVLAAISTVRAALEYRNIAVAASQGRYVRAALDELRDTILVENGEQPA